MRILFMALMMMLLAVSTASAAVYRQGVVYIIYNEEGIASPNDKADINSNGVPDRIEDIATQINAARELFKDVFKFPDPLGSDRFKNVTSIEVDIGAKTIMKANGFSMSAVRKKSKHDPNERALRIKIANTVNPHKNSTPAHEYFHQVQYGMTYFCNKWFLEGMARWSQDSVLKIKKYPDGKDISQVLDNEDYEEELFQGKYNTAGTLWYPLAVAMNDKQKIPDRLIKKYKYVDGTPVFKDNIIYGPNVMLKVLQTMKANEYLAIKEFGDMKQWRRKGRLDKRNNKIILNCVREVYNAKK